MIMSEYSDAIARAKRLSVAHEALVMGKPLVTESLVTLEDMQIYTRWLVSHYRSVKHVHSFLKVSCKYSVGNLTVHFKTVLKDACCNGRHDCYRKDFIYYVRHQSVILPLG